MSATGLAPARAERAPAGLRVNMQWVVSAAFAAFIFCGSIAFIEPSPYDFASLIAIGLWFVSGFRVHWMFAPFAALICLYDLGGFVSLIPYWNEPDPVTFMLQGFYLAVTGLFFALFFAERTLARGELALMAYTASGVLASLAAIAGYFDIAGSSALFMNYGRAMGTFKDPNVLGSYVILGALYTLQILMLGRSRRPFTAAVAMVLNLAGVFLSFSRGSWGAFVLSGCLMIGLAFATTRDARLRRRIVIGVAVSLIVVCLVAMFLMSNDAIREMLRTRLQGVGESYDDPRFFNQLRSLPTLIENPLGYGPLRFRLTFDLEPHSSYVNAFASYGWIGGFAFLLLVGTTSFVGLRLCWAASPYRGLAQVVVPTLLGFLLQGFQIDIDHWRHVYLMLGMVWGFEAARWRWLEASARGCG